MRIMKPAEGRDAVRFQQTYQGVPVIAGELIVQMDSAKNVLAVTGEILPDINISITPVVDSETAKQTALLATAKTSGMDASRLVVSEPELWIYSPDLLTPYKGDAVLVWRMNVTPTELAPLNQLVLVDAVRGGITLSINQIDAAKNRMTYDAGGGTILPGTLVCNESNPTCSGGSTDAVNAHVYAGATYDFYWTYHNRDSIDNAGMTIKSTVNYGNNYQNAFWNGSQMVYGAGFASADDVVAHELTHGVTARESNLFYYYQSGAINESFSDVWGEFVDQVDGMGNDSAAVKWLMGEDLSIGAIRSMKDPTIYGDPDKMTSANYYIGDLDNGGVHFNSGINNKAAYLMVDGDTFNGRTIAGLGITKVAKIYYEVQTNWLTSGADYLSLYYALNGACASLIGTAGITASDCTQVNNAALAVEMTSQPVPGFNPEAASCASGNPVTGSTTFSDNLESGSSNWMTGIITGIGPRWQYDSPYGPFATSGSNFLYADDYPDAITDAYVRLKAITIPQGGQMLFNQAFGFDDYAGTYYDGGVIEYSTDNGVTWADAGSLLTANGYNGTLATSYGNPLGGRSAFVADSHGYISTRMDLRTLAGKNVMFRWRMGLDSSIYDWGWWLDDISIYRCRPTFTDVSSSYWAYQWVEALNDSGITGGCGSGTYCPDNSVTRAEMAIFLLKGRHGSSYSPPAPSGTVFGDVPSNYWAARWIEQLSAEGITGGCGSNNYCPEGTVTRAQMAVFLLKAKHGSSYSPPPATGVFTDVPTNYWAAAWIERLAAEGITSGCSSGKYCPENSITRAEMAVFLARTFSLPLP